MKDTSSHLLTWDEFMKVDMRVGTILSAEHLPGARNPAYIIRVDFGEAGILKTSAQITKLYAVNEIIGLQVIGVVNFPPKQIGSFMSECLLLGAMDKDKEVILIRPERKARNGLRIG